MARRNGVSYVEGPEILPSNLAKHQVEEYAEDVRRVFNFNVAGDISELTERIGGTIHYQDLDDWVDKTGSIFVHEPLDFEIYLPSYTSPLRDRFTVGHELGHYFLHAQQGDVPIIAFRKGSTRIEWEANWFSAALLMPVEEFKKALSKTDSLSRLAAMFGVSQEAARVRKEALSG